MAFGIGWLAKTLILYLVELLVFIANYPAFTLKTSGPTRQKLLQCQLSIQSHLLKLPCILFVIYIQSKEKN